MASRASGATRLALRLASLLDVDVSAEPDFYLQFVTQVGATIKELVEVR